ncbi:putative TPR_REGION domain-containing protein [Gammaproteobacteria bacterium]
MKLKEGAQKTSRKSSLVVAFLTASLGVHAGWFQTPEQQATLNFQHEDYESAASIFSDPYRKGVAFYRAGKYQEAAAAFAQSKRPEVLIDSLYNQGNSEYQRKEYARSIVLYERVLRIESTHEDARHNLALAKSHLVLYHCPPPKVEPQKEDKKEQGTKKEKKEQKEKKDKDKEKDQKDSKQDQKDPKDQDKKDQDKKDQEKKSQEQKSKDQQENKKEGKKSENQNQGFNQENSPGKEGQDSNQKVGTKESQDTGQLPNKSGEDSSGQEKPDSKFGKDGNHEKSTNSLEKTESTRKEISEKDTHGEGIPKKIGNEQSDPNSNQNNNLGKKLGEEIKSVGGEEVSVKEGPKEQEAHTLRGDSEKLGSTENKDSSSQGTTPAERPMDLQSTETVSRLEKLDSGTDSKKPQESSFGNLDETSGENGAGLSDALAKQWMSRVEADPGRVLRRQFEVEERRELARKNGQILETRPW